MPDSRVENEMSERRDFEVQSDNCIHQKYVISGGDFSGAGTASTGIKALLKDLGITPVLIRRIAIAAYEAEMNIVMYAKRGIMELTVSPDKIDIKVSDEGCGIEDIDLAMKEGYSTATDEIRGMGFGAGMGLPNIKKNSDCFSISSETGKGTRLEISVFTGLGAVA